MGSALLFSMSSMSVFVAGTCSIGGVGVVLVSAITSSSYSKQLADVLSKLIFLSTVMVLLSSQ